MLHRVWIPLLVGAALMLGGGSAWAASGTLSPTPPLPLGGGPPKPTTTQASARLPHTGIDLLGVLLCGTALAAAGVGLERRTRGARSS